VLFMAHRSGRPKKPLAIMALSCAINCACAIVSSCLGFSSNSLIVARVTLLYLGVVLHVAGFFHAF
jgi:hypothetical protein